MSCGCESTSRKRDRVRRNRHDRFICGSPKQDAERDVRDESYRHCGCLDCRRRRNQEVY